MGVISECLNLYGERLRREEKVDYILRETLPSFSFCLQSKLFLFSGKFRGKNLKLCSKSNRDFARTGKKKKPPRRGVTAPLIEGLI